MGISQSCSLAAEFPSRALGYGEQLWLRLSEVSSNNFVMVVQIDGAVELRRLYTALEGIVLTFPVLRARVELASAPPRLAFSRVPRVPLTVVPGCADGDWPRLAEHELNNRIPADAELLWRATLLQDELRSVLLLTFNHAISDGHSAYVVVRELLQCYADASAAGPIMAPPAAYDDLLPPGQGWRMLTRCLPNFLTKVLNPAPRAAAAPANVRAQANDTVHSRFFNLLLDAPTSAGVLARSKREGVSMHALMSSALLLASYDALGGAGEKDIVISAALNVRPRLRRPSLRDVGYFATGIECRYSLTGHEDVWQLAKRVSADVDAQFTSENIAFSLQLRRLILALKKEPGSLRDALSRRSQSSVHLTNLGRPELPQHYGSLTLRACFPIPSVHFLNKPVLCLATVFFAGQLRLIFSYADPLTDPAYIDSVINQFRKRLCEVAD
ncbi:condensation domain-containing protein [Allohahella sp. A8]|uniref:condensation domain-containing protein n=1 Tax=Allohahella sp. A8 TaxID=3141461 RepID=UPI003A810A02